MRSQARENSGAERSDRKTGTPAGQRIYAIGDIHGRADLLKELHERIIEDALSIPKHIKKVAVYLGDYIDRGFNSRGVIDLLTGAPLPGFELVYLKGNHEDIFLRFLEDHSYGPGWFSVGGDATAVSYDVRLPVDIKSGERFRHVQQQLRVRVPEQHMEFLRQLEMLYLAGDYVFVHAGIRPGIPIEEQAPKDLLWIRGEFLNAAETPGKVVVHGHSLSWAPDVSRYRIGIDTGAYATDRLTCLILDGEFRRFLST